MAYGLEVKDQVGNVVFEATDKLTRFICSIGPNSEDGSGNNSDGEHTTSYDTATLEGGACSDWIPRDDGYLIVSHPLSGDTVTGVPYNSWQNGTRIYVERNYYNIMRGEHYIICFNWT